jgi:oligopeptide transport system substrate-binding protein
VKLIMMNKTLLPLALLVLAALACQLTSSLPATPESTTAPPPANTPVSSSTPAPERSPQPPAGTPAAASSAQPTRVPGPTRRAGTPTFEPGVYHNDTLGVSLNYPPQWSAEYPDSSGLLLRLEDQRQGVIALLVEGPPQNSDQDTLQSLAETLMSSVAGSKPPDQLSSEAVQLADGNPGHAVVADIQTNSGKLRIKLVLAARGGRTYAALAAVVPDRFDTLVADLDQTLYSLHLEEPRPYGISRADALVLAGGEPLTIDPARILSGAGGYVGLLFSGLVTFDTQLQVVPDLAERWEISPDGLTYTFYLRRGVTFHNGKPFTAADVKYSLERAADPQTGSNTAQTYLSDIVGVQDKLDGKAQAIAGVKVIDDYTVALTIDAPKAYFLAKLTYPTSWIVDRDNVESGKDWEEHPNGTGPFSLATWDHNQVMIFDRNPAYYRAKVGLAHVLFLLYQGVPLQMYEVGDIDITSVSGDSLARVSDPQDPLNQDLVSAPAFCTSRVVFDVAQKPFDDPKVRLAFFRAIDREKLRQAIDSQNTLTLANGILPPGMPGYSGDIQAPSFDLTAAQQLLAESSYGGPAGLPEIVYSNSGLGEPDRVTSALVDMWSKNLGVQVKIVQVDPKNWEDTLYGKHGQIVDYGWCADYPDPENFLDVLYHTGQKSNVGHYSDPQVDRLLEQARSEPDVSKRLALYHQVEQLVIDSAAALPLWNGSEHALVKPYVKNFVLTPIDVPQYQFVTIER